jgi:hypothetical protein
MFALAGMALAAPGGAQAAACCSQPPGSAEQFVARLLRVADETQPARVATDFQAVFGTQLARYTRVLVSELMSASRNGVARFVQLGEADRPLRFDASDRCISFAVLADGLRADHWEGGMTEVPGFPGRTWHFLKGGTQLTADAATGRGAAAACVGTIVITFRAPRSG